MSGRNIYSVLSILLVISSGTFCWGSEPGDQNPLDKALLEAMAYYYSGHYSRTVQVLQDALEMNKKGDRLSAHKFIAFSYVAMGNSSAAQDHFKKMLDIEPHYILDSTTVSIETYNAFQSARQERTQEAAMCSCFIPGWAQMMTGQEKKGRIIMISSAITLGAGAISWIITDGKHKDYLTLGPDDRHRMDELYYDYNTWYRISLGTTALFVACYVYSIIDAFPRLSTNEKTGTSFQLKYDVKRIEVGYHINL